MCVYIITKVRTRVRQFCTDILIKFFYFPDWMSPFDRVVCGEYELLLLIGMLLYYYRHYLHCI